MYDVLLAFGRAVDEKTLELPPEVYDYLDRLAMLYVQLTQAGSGPIVIVSGRQRAKFVYQNNPLRYQDGHEVVEASLMARYLHARYGITAWQEDRSGSVGDNLAYSKFMLMQRRVPVKRACIVTIGPLATRIQMLGRLIFGDFCKIDVQSIETDATAPQETKLLHDQLCMLKDMRIGDHSHIIGNGIGSSFWPLLGAKHKASCPYAELDRHPDYIMRSLLTDFRI